MSNSIKTTLKVEWYDETVLTRPQPTKTYTVETDSDIVHDTTQLVGTTHETISVGDATDDCFAAIYNLHATAVAQVGVDDTGVFVPLIDILPGGPPAIMPQVSTLAATYLKSDTVSTPIRVLLCKIV